MNMSEKKREEVYKAASDPIMDLRVKNQMHEGIDWDGELFAHA